jgi:hypothetical protein
MDTPPPTYPQGNFSLGHGFYLLYGFGMWGNKSCGSAIEFPNGYIMRDPMLPFFSFIALLIGVICGSRIRASGFKNSQSYAVTFFTYGTMMTFAAFADSIIPISWLMGSHASLADYVMLIDVWLTSSIATSFMFNGLADVGIISAGSRRTMVVEAVAYLSILGGYYYGFFIHPNMNVFQYLYLYLIATTCGLYLACELVYLFWMGHSQGILYLILSGISGGVGLYFTKYFPVWLCTMTTPVFGSSVLWFFLSDVAMFFIYLFYMQNHSPEAEIRADKRKSHKEAEDSDDADSVPLVPVYIERQ